MKYSILLLIPFLTHCANCSLSFEKSIFSCSKVKTYEDYRVVQDITVKQIESTEQPDIVSIPANLSDYYVYDSETGDWEWLNDVSIKESRNTKSTTIKSKRPISTKKETDSWVIFVYGADKNELKKQFPTRNKKYELCLFNKKEMRLDCDSN